MEEAYEEELIADGTIAQDSTQQAAIWQLRESISEGLRHAGKTRACHMTCCSTVPCQQLSGGSKEASVTAFDMQAHHAKVECTQSHLTLIIWLCMASSHAPAQSVVGFFS